jgi:hypothetical protein
MIRKQHDAPMIVCPCHLFASANDAEPKHNQMVLVPSLRAMMTTGTVVVAREEPNDGNGNRNDESCWIGWIISVKDKFNDVPPPGQREFISTLEHNGLHFVQ